LVKILGFADTVCHPLAQQPMPWDEYPDLGVELLRRAIERGRPLTQEEVDAVFPEDWKPDDLTLIL
jgi:hypothetical protein